MDVQLFTGGVVCRGGIETDHGAREAACYVGRENIARNGCEILIFAAALGIAEGVLVTLGAHAQADGKTVAHGSRSDGLGFAARRALQYDGGLVAALRYAEDVVERLTLVACQSGQIAR